MGLASCSEHHKLVKIQPHVYQLHEQENVVRDLRFSQFTMFNQHNMLEELNLLCM